jgi:hypothetical protein
MAEILSTAALETPMILAAAAAYVITRLKR